MEKTLKRIDIYVIVFALIVAGYFVWSANQVLGGAPAGLPATIGTSSTVLVGTSTPMTLTATTTGCAARIITTGAQAIRISFSHHLSSTTLGNGIGHFQGGSTTVAYDSGLYGCDFTTALGVYEGGDILGSESSSTVTVTVSF